jgi:hypothetical protein
MPLPQGSNAYIARISAETLEKSFVVLAEALVPRFGNPNIAPIEEDVSAHVLLNQSLSKCVARYSDFPESFNVLTTRILLYISLIRGKAATKLSPSLQATLANAVRWNIEPEKQIASIEVPLAYIERLLAERDAYTARLHELGDTNFLLQCFVRADADAEWQFPQTP